MFNEPGVPESPEEAAAHRAALLQSPEERGLAKQTAREACSGEELALLQCYKDGSFIACTAARSAFWQCYKKHRVCKLWRHAAPCA
jgi:hypothetical protein